jgi:hypothetical protein
LGIRTITTATSRSSTDMPPVQDGQDVVIMSGRRGVAITARIP